MLCRPTLIAITALLVSHTCMASTISPQLKISDTAHKSVTAPLTPEYLIADDGSIMLRICYNWSCGRRQVLNFTADDMDTVKNKMAICPDTTLHDRLQQVRIGIWQMETLAQKYQPLFANDLAINDSEADKQGRMDCVDNTSNTSTYLHILRDIGVLSGWTVSSPIVRNRFDVGSVHWTAVISDTESNQQWSVDSWYRPNGHLPIVMPLKSWRKSKKGWEAPYNQMNETPYAVEELCSDFKAKTLTLQ